MTASYLVLREAIQTEREGVRVVRLAAEQRVAGERICFLSHALVGAIHDEERKYYRSTLKEAIQDMAYRHTILSLQHAPDQLPEKMRRLLHEIYFEGLKPFNPSVDRFLENARKIAETGDERLHNKLPELLKVNFAGSRAIMQTHKLISNLLDKEAVANVNRIPWLGARAVDSDTDAPGCRSADDISAHGAACGTQFGFDGIGAKEG